TCLEFRRVLFRSFEGVRQERGKPMYGKRKIWSMKYTVFSYQVAVLLVLMLVEVLWIIWNKKTLALMFELQKFRSYQVPFYLTFTLVILQLDQINKWG